MTDAEITADGAESLVGKRLKFYTDDGERTLTVIRVDYPYVIGATTKKSRAYGDTVETIQIRVNLHEVSRIEVKHVEKTKTVLVVIIAVPIFLIIFEVAVDVLSAR